MEWCSRNHTHDLFCSLERRPWEFYDRLSGAHFARHFEAEVVPLSFEAALKWSRGCLKQKVAQRRFIWMDNHGYVCLLKRLHPGVSIEQSVDRYPHQFALCMQWSVGHYQMAATH